MTDYKQFITPYLLVEFDEFLNNYKDIAFIRESLQIQQIQQISRPLPLLDEIQSFDGLRCDRRTSPSNKIQKLSDDEKIHLLRTLEELGDICYELFGIRPFNSYVRKLKDITEKKPEYFIILSGCSDNDIYEDINSYRNIKFIKEKINQLNNLTKDELIELKEELLNLQHSLTRGVLYYPQNGFIFDNDIELCTKRLNEMNTKFSKTHILMQESEIINGYQLYDISHDIFALDIFELNLPIWNDDQEFTLDEFRKEFSNTACSDWHKMDRFGKSYGGFWEYPEDSIEKDDAWNLTFEDNMLGLYELPYPKKFVLATVKMGCNNRMECVRYSNCLCEWFKRKLKAMENFVGEMITTKQLKKTFTIGLNSSKDIDIVQSVAFLPKKEESQEEKEEEIIIPEDNPDDWLKGKREKENDIDIVMRQANVSRTTAFNALCTEKWDLVNAIMSLT